MVAHLWCESLAEDGWEGKRRSTSGGGTMPAKVEPVFGWNQGGRSCDRVSLEKDGGRERLRVLICAGGVGPRKKDGADPCPKEGDEGPVEKVS